MSQKTKHGIVLAALVTIGGIICLYLKSSYLASILCFLIIPSIYLSLISKESIKKAALFSVMMIGIPLVIDGLLIVNKAWSVETIFSFKILHLIPIEDLLFSFFCVYLIVMLYGFFIKPRPKEKNILVNKNLATLSIVLIGVFIYLYFTHPNVLYIPYAYVLTFFFAGIIPTTLFLFSHPRFLRDFSIISFFVFFFALFYEVVALKIGAWSFPGTEYIALVSFFGVQFPFEEFLFFLVLFPIGILTFYEFFTYKK